MTESSTTPNAAAFGDGKTVRSQMATYAKEIVSHIKAAYQVLLIQTPELAAAEEMLANVARQLNKDEPPKLQQLMMVSWDQNRGFYSYVGRDEGLNYVPQKYTTPQYKQPLAAISAVVPPPLKDGERPNTRAIANLEEFPPHTVFVFNDLDDMFVLANVRSELAMLAARVELCTAAVRHPIVILTASTAPLPEKLKPYIKVLSLPLPSREDLTGVVSDLVGIHNVPEETKARYPMAKSTIPNLVDNLLGMTGQEAENAVALALVKYGTAAHPEVLPMIRREKANVIAKSGVLKFIEDASIPNMEYLCGFEGYTTWLSRRAKAYTQEARMHKIDPPRGVVVLGVPGTGKSQLAKATCRTLNLPGYVLDVGSLFGSLVGESEARVRNVLQILDAQKGCVLVIDEADKGLGNAHESKGDSGVTRRVFGQLLTWLAENDSSTFVIMTLNRTEGLPPELFRAGRFDKIFYTDLPSPAVRKQILFSHLRKRGVDPASIATQSEDDWDLLVRATDEFVGSELEHVVVESRHMAMTSRGDGIPTFDEMMAAAASLKPMAKTEAEAIQVMRQFCISKATPVTADSLQSAPNVTSVALKQRRRRVQSDVNEQ